MNSVATILPYKGNRPTDKPKYWQEIREHLIDNYGAEICYGIEADDKLGIEQFKEFNSYQRQGWYKEENLETIICSRDKDLNMIPGWHYSWECGNQKERKWFINETDALRFFYKQLLTGDSTDNVLGLFGVGEKASCVKALDSLTSEQAMLSLVLGEYHRRFGSYCYEFIVENATLLWILRDGSEGTTEAEERIRRLVFDEKISEESSDEASIQTESGEGQDKV
jgi:hypothetical protein